MKHKFIFPNLVLSRFNVSSSSTQFLWCIDDTKICFKNKECKISALAIMDVGSRKILKILTTRNSFNTKHIVRALKNLIIENKIPDQVDPEKRLIIHTDRDAHFSSRKWAQFEFDFSKKIRLSMSGHASPQHNGVAERLNRTIKTLPIQSSLPELNGQTLQQFFSSVHSEQLNTKKINTIFDHFTEFYNHTHYHRIMGSTPQLSDSALNYAKAYLAEPEILAVRNGKNAVLEEQIKVAEYRKNAFELLKNAQSSISSDGLVDKEKMLLLNIEKALRLETKKLAELNQAQFLTLNKKLDAIFEKISEIDKKSQKVKKNQVSMPMQEPVLFCVFKQMLSYVSANNNSHSILSAAQFRIAIVLMYCTGCRIHETRFLNSDQLHALKVNQRMNLYDSKNDVVKVIVGTNKTKELLDEVQVDIDLIFNQFKLPFLSCSLRNKKEAMSRPSWTRAINSKMQESAQQAGLQFHWSYTSHCFRIGFVTKLLLKNDLYKVKQVIGHKNTKTTETYQRYLLKMKQSSENQKLDDFIDVNLDDSF